MSDIASPAPASASLAGRTLLITGASSGVGRHLAAMLASCGARVACCARRRASLDTLVGEVAAAGGTAAAIDCDVTDQASVIAAFDRARETLGPIDGVICNAGVNRSGSSLKLAIADIDAVIATNLRGAFLTSREGARRMIADAVPEDRRRIVFISSMLGTKPLAGAAMYNATKAGVNLMSKSLALEWARRSITVNAICPGYMRTDILDDWFETEGGRAMMARWPRQRFMALAALDPALLFLLSLEAASTTGCEILIDEGQAIG